MRHGSWRASDSRYSTPTSGSRRARPSSAPVLVVDIDDDSLRQIGQWPWPRTRVAELIDKLQVAGAAVIGLDIILAEPDLTSPENVIPLWAATEAAATIRDAVKDLPEHDAVLADAVRRAPVVTGFALTRRPNAVRPPRPYAVEIAGPSPVAVLPEFAGAVVNLPRIDAGARGVGGFNFLPAVDGVLRRIPLVLRIGEEISPSFTAEMLRVLLGADGYQIRVEPAGIEGALPAIEEVAVGGLVIPTDEAGRMWLHFTRPEARRSLPAWQVLAGAIAEGALSGQVVTVGTSAAGLKDLRATPLDLAATGVAVHATAVEQMLLGHFLQRPAWVEPVELIYTLLLGLILILLLRRLKALGCLALGVLTVVAAAGSSWYAYTEHRLLIDPVLPSLAALLAYMGGSLINLIRTEAERRRVRTTFGHYLAPAVVQQLMDNPETLRLGGERRGDHLPVHRRRRVHFLDRGPRSGSAGAFAERVSRQHVPHRAAPRRDHRQDRRRCAAHHVQRPRRPAGPCRARDRVRAGARRVLPPLTRRGSALSGWISVTPESVSTPVRPWSAILAARRASTTLRTATRSIRRRVSRA